MAVQVTFAEEPNLSRCRKQTQPERFLAEMDAVVPWVRLVALVEPYYPKGGSGSKPMPLERMMRIHIFLQQCFCYSDPRMKDAHYEVPLLRQFVGIDLVRDSVPDETAILKFRCLLERHALVQAIFAEVQAVLQDKGLLLQQGKTVDDTWIHAPSSTKNRDRKRDPEMISTKKENQWYFGMKAHVAADIQGIVQAVDLMAAEVPDHQMLDGLRTGEESVVLAARGYDYPRAHATLATCGIADAIARRRYPGQKTRLVALKRYNRVIARIRARGTHVLWVLKCQFSYQQTRYRRLGMNAAQLTTLFVFSSLYMLWRYLLATQGVVRPDFGNPSENNGFAKQWAS